jgi:hypothetical protein
MKTVAKLEFVPRLALPFVSGSDQFVTDGSFFLVTGRSFFLTDFVSGDLALHISREFEVVIDPMLAELISRFQMQLLLPESLNVLKQLKLQILPVMTSSDSDEWNSTLCWLRGLLKPHSNVLSDLYQAYLVERDQKNAGEKLRDFLVENGIWVNRCLHFVMQLDEPIRDFIARTQPVSKLEFSTQYRAALSTACVIQKKLIHRLVQLKGSESVLSISHGFCFNTTLNSRVPLRAETYSERFATRFKGTAMNKNFPLLEIGRAHV